MLEQDPAPKLRLWDSDAFLYAGLRDQVLALAGVRAGSRFASELHRAAMGAPSTNLPSQGDETGPPEPAFKAYGSGAPKWFGLPIYLATFAIAVAVVAPQALHPYRLTGFGGFLTLMMDKYIFVVAAVVAFAVWRWVTWRLRARYPDKLLVSADDLGIGLPSGYVIPYAGIRRIDPHSRGSSQGAYNWIEIDAGGSERWKIDVTMSVDPPEQILAALRERAFAGGANLTPVRPNGRLPVGGSQLGYREGMEWRG